ncbi:MAG: tryptophan--tRNA ligase [Thermotogae bacterium]|nr:tryptophan--tRNA ligase [Thermotogota bacterium]
MRVLSGMRPTGRLHVGHLVGALDNWVRIQNEGNECFYFIADWHALTTNYDDVSKIYEYTIDIIRTFLACGIDPDKSVVFVQSAIKEHAELQLLFSMITPVGWLERVPTYKEIKQQLSYKDLSNLGFLAYPVLQAADILIYKPDGVPVGQDQVYHVELTREIARRFNYLYGQVFPEPKELLSHLPKLPGTDGRKMSKSYGNVILIDTTEDELREKILRMMTDPARKRRSDPGDPEKCPVWNYHKAFGTTDDEKEYIKNGCRTASIGCIDCKKVLLGHMIERLKPIWKRLDELKKNEEYVHRIINEGNEKARAFAIETIKEAREAMNLRF